MDEWQWNVVAKRSNRISATGSARALDIAAVRLVFCGSQRGTCAVRGSPVVAVGRKQRPRQVVVEPAEAGKARGELDSRLHVKAWWLARKVCGAKVQ